MEVEHEASLAEAILQTLNIAVLKRVGPMAYELASPPPAFYTILFPPEADTGEPCRTPWEHSYMLEYFMEDAEAFFSRKLSGSIASGVWQEDSLSEDDQAFIAEAMLLAGSELLIIRLLKEDFNEKVGILRKAREQLLERRLLSNDLEVYKTKSRFDGLTKVLNRTTFMEHLGREIRKAAENSVPLSVAMLDIDNFKRVNDSYGHLSGDFVLTTLGELLRSNLRRDDIVARYGGEEFILLAPYTTKEQIFRTAEKLRKNVARHVFMTLPQVTVSIGCATFIPGESMENLVQRADLALYEAKNAGKNCVKVH